MASGGGHGVNFGCLHGGLEKEEQCRPLFGVVPLIFLPSGT